MGLTRIILSLLFMVLASLTAEVNAQEPLKEKNLYIYGDLDSAVSTPLVKEFEALHNGVKIDFINMSSSEVFYRYMGDVAAGKVSADILWNRDVTLQAALMKDGYALGNQSSPDPAILKGGDTSQSVFAVAIEPVVMVYNKNLIIQKDLPLTREALGKKAGVEQWRGKTGTVDPEKSSKALLLLTQDLAHDRDFWGLVRRFGNGSMKMFPDYQAVLSAVDSGELLFAYNIPLSEALKFSGEGKTAAWYYMADYNLAIPETSLIAKRATNPVNARLWIDFIRTEKAQKIISSGLNRYPVRKDLTVAGMSGQAGVLPEGGRLRIIAADSEVARFMPDGVRRGFILRWKQLLKQVK